MNLLLLTSHSIAEYDDLRMFSDAGYDAFSIGAYTDPAHTADDKRPALPEVPYHSDLAAYCERQREKHAGESTLWVVDWAKGDLHPTVIEWADAIIVHHFPIPWIVAQWPRLKHKRVIWRTCGQSDPALESYMAPLRGLQIVRYSPRERIAFEKAGSFAGEDALIRFGKYPSDWHGWTGEEAVVGNVTQDMADRADATNLAFYLAATKGLPAKPAGPGSEKLPGGIGALSYDDMRAYLRRIRAYLYTGTQPASYTLGLIEAMMTGVPVVSIGPKGMWMPDLFEGHDLAAIYGNTAEQAGFHIAQVLHHPSVGDWIRQRQRAIELFGIERISAEWRAFLGEPAQPAKALAEAAA